MKNKKVLFILGITILFLIIIMLLKIYDNSSSDLKTYNDTIYFKYNNFWKLNKYSDLIKLKNEDNVINVYHKNINKSLSYEEIAKLIINNYEYNKITEKDKMPNINNLDNMTFILEKDDKEISLTIFKKGTDIIIVEYISTLKKFDFYFDSVITLNYYIDIKDVK